MNITSFGETTNDSVLALSNGTTVPTSRHNGKQIQLALAIIQSLILTIGITGNTASIVCLYLSHRRRRRLTRMSLFIFHLCIADLSVSLFNVAPNLCMVISYPKACPFQSNDVSCKMVNFLSLTSIYGSTYVLVMTSLDRYLAICHPLLAQRLTNKHVHIICVIAWVLSMAFSIPQLIIFSFNKLNLVCATRWNVLEEVNTRHENMYVAWFASAVWIIPCIVISVCYVSITCAICNRPVSIHTKAAKRTPSTSQRSRILMKPILLTFAVIIGYIVCWSPWMLTMLIQQFSLKHAAKMSQGEIIVMELMTYLIGFNSCLNPFIYLCFNCQSFCARSKPKSASTVVTSTFENTGRRRNTLSDCNHDHGDSIEGEEMNVLDPNAEDN